MMTGCCRTATSSLKPNERKMAGLWMKRVNAERVIKRLICPTTMSLEG